MRLISDVLLKQWEETAISKIQRSAHNVDMRLMRPKELFRFFQQNRQKQLSWKDAQLIVDQLKAVDGVVEVNYNFTENTPHVLGGMYSLQKTTISPLGFNATLNGQTVSVVAQFVDTTGVRESQIEVVVEFFGLVEQIVNASWWKGNKAFILDQHGAILASTERVEEIINNTSNTQRIFGLASELEANTWQAIQNNTSGTVFSPERPPATVSGFYHLKEAPWTIVVMAEGSSVLAPHTHF